MWNRLWTRGSLEGWYHRKIVGWNSKTISPIKKQDNVKSLKFQNGQSTFQDDSDENSLSDFHYN